MRPDKAACSPVILALKGALVCAASFILSIVAVGTACYFSPNPVSYYGICGFLSFILSAIISTLINARRSRAAAPILPICSALTFALLILAISLVISGGKCAGSLVGALVCYAMISVLLTVIARKSGEKKKSAYSRHKRARAKKY